jgi:hypothetical protein
MRSRGGARVQESPVRSLVALPGGRLALPGYALEAASRAW